MKPIENEILNLIGQVAEPESENRLDPDNVRSQIAANLELQAAEIDNFPELEGEPYCALLAADYDRTKRAMLILVLFMDKEVFVATGLGDFADIRKFAETDFPEDHSQAISQAQQCFHVTIPRKFARSEFESWLLG